jgi:1-acyl-sn-glycerol-3-phosphate acyltransferase
MLRVLKPLIEALFRVLFTYDCLGEENVPATGPAVVASNHPSYLDPVLLSLQVPRPIHFMAWDALFKVPGLGPLLRSFGAFPVDIRRGKGREAYEKARALVAAGHMVGIFPEGRRSQAGWMEPSLREGAARLSFETGAPLVPATIAGAFRAWPHFKSLPSPARIRVRFHAPIDPAAFRDLPEDEALAALLAELRRRVDRSLLPGVKADLRTTVLYAGPAPPPRLVEAAAVAAVAVGFVATGAAARAPLFAAVYLAYLFLDWRYIPQSRLAKRVRNGSALVFLAAALPFIVRRLGGPEIPALPALVAVVWGAVFPYLYEHGRTSWRFLQGMAAVLLLEAACLVLWPSATGPHVALPLFAALFAYSRRTVYFEYAAPVLLLYAIAVPWLLGGGRQDLPHLFVALLAWVASGLGRLRWLRTPPVAGSP